MNGQRHDEAHRPNASDRNRGANRHGFRFVGRPLRVGLRRPMTDSGSGRPKPDTRCWMTRVRNVGGNGHTIARSTAAPALPPSSHWVVAVRPFLHTASPCSVAVLESRANQGRVTPCYSEGMAYPTNRHGKLGLSALAVAKTKTAARPESLSAAYETNAEAGAPVALTVAAMVERHEPHDVRTVAAGRTRPENRTRRVREAVRVDGRRHPAVLDQAGKLLHVGQPPVDVTREGAGLGVDQRIGPGESLRRTGLAGRAAQALGALLPHEPGARVGHRPVAMIGVPRIRITRGMIVLAGGRLGGTRPHYQPRQPQQPRPGQNAFHGLPRLGAMDGVADGRAAHETNRLLLHRLLLLAFPLLKFTFHALFEWLAEDEPDQKFELDNPCT